jgi:hypothetical protein
MMMMMNFVLVESNTNTQNSIGNTDTNTTYKMYWQYRGNTENSIGNTTNTNTLL